MLKLGIGLTKTGTSLDIDAPLFCERSRARDVGRISEFVRGIKKLGLWNSMVCWPLRSAQNVGTGTTAYSLGGLGTFNGRLTNVPTWGADALDFTANNSGMDTDVVLPIAPVALMVVRQAQQAQTDNAGLFYTAGVNVSGRQFSQNNTGSVTTQGYKAWHSAWPPSNLALNSNINITGSSRTDREYGAWRILSSSTVRLSRNSTQSASNVTVTGWDTSSPAFTRFGYYPDAGADDTLSFMAYFTAAIDNTADAAFYTLYKETLGQGLGLP